MGRQTHPSTIVPTYEAGTDGHRQGLNSEFGMGKAVRRIWNAEGGEAGRMGSEEAGKILNEISHRPTQTDTDKD